MNKIDSNVIRKFCTDSLDLFKTVNKIWPGYPESLVTKTTESVYKANLVSHLGHPNEKIHTMWAEMILPKIKETIYAMDQKNSKQN